MIEDLEQEDSGMSGVVYCQWLETELEVWIEEDVTVEYANFCAKVVNYFGLCKFFPNQHRFQNRKQTKRDNT